MDGAFGVIFFLHNFTFWEDKKEDMCSNVRIQLPLGLKKFRLRIFAKIRTFLLKLEHFRKKFFTKIDENSGNIKEIVSRKFDMLFWCRWIDKYFLHLFYFIRFLKYHRFHVEFSNIKRSAVTML
jgi:hypothetical protein